MSFCDVAGQNGQCVAYQETVAGAIAYAAVRKGGYIVANGSTVVSSATGNGLAAYIASVTGSSGGSVVTQSGVVIASSGTVLVSSGVVTGAGSGANAGVVAGKAKSKNAGESSSILVSSIVTISGIAASLLAATFLF